MLTVRPQYKVCLTLCNFRFERLGCTKPYKNDLIAWLTKPLVLYAQLRKGCFACKSKICNRWVLEGLRKAQALLFTLQTAYKTRDFVRTAPAI